LWGVLSLRKYIEKEACFFWHREAEKAEDGFSQSFYKTLGRKRGFFEFFTRILGEFGP